MDANVIVAIVTALSALGAEIAAGAANSVGAEAWSKVKGLLGSETSDALVESQSKTSELIAANPDLIEQLKLILEESGNKNAATLVGSVSGKKVIVANVIDKIKM